MSIAISDHPGPIFPADRERKQLSKGDRIRAERAARAAGGKDLPTPQDLRVVEAPSPSHLQKLNRARQHVKDLEVMRDLWLGTDAYTLVPEIDPQTGRTLVRARVTKPPPADFALVMGDAIHALRASLDHLALELAIAQHRPQMLPNAIEENSEFVIVGCPNKAEGSQKFRSAAGRKLNGVEPKARDAIEGMQPYHREASFAEDPLWFIHELDRIDKHRRLNLTAYAMGGVGIGAGRIGELHLEQVGHDGPVENGDVVASFTVRNSNFQMEFARHIAFAEPSLPQGACVVETLSTLHDHVLMAIAPLLQPFL